MANEFPEATRFEISKHASGYYQVSTPNYEGGEVVKADSYDALRAGAEAVLSRKWLRDLALNHRSDCAASTLYDKECNCGLKDYLATDDQLRAALHPQGEEGK